MKKGTKLAFIIGITFFITPQIIMRLIENKTLETYILLLGFLSWFGGVLIWAAIISLFRKQDEKQIIKA